MKIITEKGIINLEKYDKVEFRESFFGKESGYPVEAIRQEVSGGIFGGTTTIIDEIARVNSEHYAKELVEKITESWLKGEEYFDVNKWFNT